MLGDTDGGFAAQRITELPDQLLQALGTARVRVCQCAKLCQRCPLIKRAQRLANQFIEYVRKHQAEHFEDWLTAARESQITELVNFATGLLSDKAAVMAALSEPWSNGQTEGQINRLKCIKRQMYGRANLDLLRIRVLPPLEFATSR